MRTRIKICGLSSLSQAQASVRAGADAIGLVFHPASPRFVSVSQAVEIAAELPAFVASVALFMNAEERAVREVIQQVQPTMLQFHGEESSSYCRSFGLPYLKAVPMGGDVDVAQYARTFADARGLLLDSHAPGDSGGSGQTFDWTKTLPDNGPPIILAGGLNPANIAQAIRSMRPYGVDVSSGVEASPGAKDVARIQAFVLAVQKADAQGLDNVPD